MTPLTKSPSSEDSMTWNCSSAETIYGNCYGLKTVSLQVKLLSTEDSMTWNWLFSDDNTIGILLKIASLNISIW